jgi:glutathione S-transferase
MAEWVDIDKARTLPGLRLVLTAGVPGPWGEAAKGVFHVKGIPFARVRQEGGRDNEALFEWTGHRNAPVAVFDDERTRLGWTEILHLAERLVPEPALVPADPDERVLFFGLANELLGENGFGWCRRLMLFRNVMGDAEEPPEAMRPFIGRMLGQYGYSREAALAAPARLASILRLFSARLRAQREAGSAFLLGDRLSALDVYWAAFAGLVEPLPPEYCPMSEAMRGQYTAADPILREALDPALLEHRDAIYRDYLEFPIEL